MNRLLLSIITLFTLANCAAAQNNETLQQSREQVVKRYILDLQKADYKEITQLFEHNGTVISTSRGKVDAKEFFYSFLPNIISAKTETHHYFVSKTDSNRIVARFNFTFKLKDGEEGNGEYVDEFIFLNHSEKLSAVYMFENLKFKNETNIR